MATVKLDMCEAGYVGIVAADSNLELIADDLRFGEGPVWNQRTQEFYWVDIVGDTIWKWSQRDGRNVMIRPSHRANGMTLDQEGRLMVAGWGRRCIWRREHDGFITTLAAEYQGKRINSPNDIVVKSDGAVYFTDPSGALFNVQMEGDDVQRYLDFHGVYRISPEGKLTLVVDDFVYPNGLAFSPDESLLYINDTRQNLIRVFSVAPDGSLSDGKLFAKLAGTEPGRADGMKVDVQGNVYCTGPAGIHVFDPGGAQLCRILVPGHSTNFSFGGEDWKSMFAVTQTSVFRFPVQIAGLAVPS